MNVPFCLFYVTLFSLKFNVIAMTSVEMLHESRVRPSLVARAR